MFVKILEGLPRRLRRFLGDTAYRMFLKKGSSLVNLFSVLLFGSGIKVKLVRKGMYLARVGELKLLVPSAAVWGIYEILWDEVYEHVFKVKQGDKVIDVGAEFGLFTVKAAKAVREKGLVIAIEPHSGSMAILSENVKNNNLKNVLLVQKAIGSQGGKAKLYLPYKSTLRVGKEYIDVDVDTLDNIAKELKLGKVDFIKIDVEGAELEVLRGANKILSSPNIKLAIAAYHNLSDGTPEFQKILSYLRSKRMRVWTKDSLFIYAKTCARCHGT